MGFEPTMSAGERTQTYALDRAASGTGGSSTVSCRNLGVNDYSLEKHAKMEKHANTFETCIKKKPKLRSKSCFAMTLFDWHIVTYVSKVHNAFTSNLLDSEDDGTNTIET